MLFTVRSRSIGVLCFELFDSELQLARQRLRVCQCFGRLQKLLLQGIGVLRLLLGRDEFRLELGLMCFECVDLFFRRG